MAMRPATLGARFGICLKEALSVFGDGGIRLPQFSVNTVEQISVLQVTGDSTAQYEMLR
jgi:hypothetical protein